MNYSEWLVQEFFESVYDFPKKTHQMYRFAKRKHDDTGVIRRGTGEPYFVHPEAVAKIVIAYGGNDTEIKAALAHDTMEDTGATFDDIQEKFGSTVAGIVKELTNDNFEIAKFGKLDYMNHKLTTMSKSALFVKLADILHNSTDKCRPDQLERMKLNIDYLVANRKDLDGRHWELIDSIMEVMGAYNDENIGD